MREGVTCYYVSTEWDGDYGQWGVSCQWQSSAINGLTDWLRKLALHTGSPHLELSPVLHSNLQPARGGNAIINAPNAVYSEIIIIDILYLPVVPGSQGANGKVGLDARRGGFRNMDIGALFASSSLSHRKHKHWMSCYFCQTHNQVMLLDLMQNEKGFQLKYSNESLLEKFRSRLHYNKREIL